VHPLVVTATLPPARPPENPIHQKRNNLIMPRAKSPNPQTPVSNTPLTALELRIVCEFVTEAARTYGDHSLNDFELPDTPVRRALVQAAIDFIKRKGDEPYPLHARDGVICYYDVDLMEYLAPRWETLSERVASGLALGPPLCREELETMASVLDMLARNGYKEYATLKEAADYSLELTPEGQRLAEAVFRHAEGGTGKRIKAAEFGYDIHVVKCLKYLAARCRALAAVSPDNGLPFTDLAKASPRRTVAPTQAGAAGAIPVLKRPGVGPAWLRAWLKHVALCKGAFKSKHGQYEVDQIKKYAAEGFPGRNVQGMPPIRGWQIDLPSNLNTYVFWRICLVEEEALKSKTFPATQWRSLFAATYLQSFSIFCGKPQFQEEEQWAIETYPIVYYAAMGMVMGFREHALRMARLQVLAHRLKMFSDPEYYPAAQTILRIFADYFGEPDLTLEGEVLTQPVYNALVKHWRHADAEALVPLLLSVCDEHTRRNVRGKPYGDEFDFLQFMRTPVEVLLVFKLRQELGLANPKLDHPLMNTPLGVLPKAVPFEFDELLAPVVKRMRQDSFDEEAILADFVAAVKKQAMCR
jgi:hypothetical protein